MQGRIAKGGVWCWLLNTGWTGGKYVVGNRMTIKATRALLNAALNGDLEDVAFRRDDNFGFDVPVSVPALIEKGINQALLNPRETWADKADYDATASKLVQLFIDNFAEFEAHVDEGVRQAAPVAA